MEVAMASALNKLRRDRRVEYVDDEREIGNGIIVTLRQGWTFDWIQDNRVAGADTATDALKLLKQAQPFAGPYEK
jgi:hypothetical protein